MPSDEVQKKIAKTDWFTWGKRVLIALALAFLVLEGRAFFAEIDFAEARRLLGGIPQELLILNAILGHVVISFVALYDFVWFCFNPHGLTTWRIFSTAWVASAINNIACMGGMGGAMTRAVFYRKAGLADSVIIRLNVMLFPSFFAGLGALMWFNLLGVRFIEEIQSSYPAAYALILVFGAYLLVYLLSEAIPFTRLRSALIKWGFVGSMRLKLSMVAVSSVNWLAICVLMWFIGIQINPSLGLLPVIFFFTVATCIGVVSPMPAGIGFFDLIMLMGLQLAGSSPEEAISIVLLFRIFFHVLPFLTAMCFLAVEMRRGKQ